MRNLFVILLALLVVTACDNTPDYVIPPKKMAALMADVHTGEAVVEGNARSFPNDSVKKTFMQSIYLKHGVTSQDVDTSLYWYGHNLNKYMDVYNKTIEILENRIAEAEKAGGKSDRAPMRVSLDGDSVDIWQGASTRRNSPFLPSEYLTFHYSTDKNWERGDRYTVSVKPIGTHSPVSINIAVEYNDGTTEYVSASENGEGMKRLVLVLDSAKVASNVYGSIHYSPRGDEVSYLDSISVVRTRGRNDNVRARAGQKMIHHR
ncbi:MAG: DUF4296 domain-containing protein [Muribaculaceae bacterium]|nr:DUF4296 domain-containing protein [Muribaculaceae bacterium]